MITEIGIIAGEIWHYLDKYNKVLLDDLVVGIKRPKDLVLMSLGWLSREGHVLIDNGNSNYIIWLRELKNDL